jgi:hypothetical protein
MKFPLANLYTFIDAIASLEFLDGGSGDWDDDDECDDDDGDDESGRFRVKRKALSSSRRRQSWRVKRGWTSRDLQPRSSTCSSDSSKLSKCPDPAPTASSFMSADKCSRLSTDRVGSHINIQHQEQQVDFEPKMDLESNVYLKPQTPTPTAAKKSRRFCLPFRRGGSQKRTEKNFWTGKSVTVGLFTGPY